MLENEIRSCNLYINRTAKMPGILSEKWYSFNPLNRSRPRA